MKITYSIMKSVFKKILMLAAFFSIGCANARCIMPTADGGGIKNVSSRNLAGYIKKFDGRYIYIEDGSTQKIVIVDASRIEYIFSAYGGDAPLSAIEPGMAARIWYKNCRLSSKNKPIAAYVEVFVFSGKLDEKMPKDYFVRPGR